MRVNVTMIVIQAIINHTDDHFRASVIVPNRCYIGILSSDPISLPGIPQVPLRGKVRIIGDQSRLMLPVYQGRERLNLSTIEGELQPSKRSLRIVESPYVCALENRGRLASVG